MNATVERLMEMRREIRELPHIDCEVVEIVPGITTGKCSCYKHNLQVALLDAEFSVRESVGMELF